MATQVHWKIGRIASPLMWQAEADKISFACSFVMIALEIIRKLFKSPLKSLREVKASEAHQIHAQMSRQCLLNATMRLI